MLLFNCMTACCHYAATNNMIQIQYMLRRCGSSDIQTSLAQHDGRPPPLFFFYLSPPFFSSLTEAYNDIRFQHIIVRVFCSSLPLFAKSSTREWRVSSSQLLLGQVLVEERGVPFDTVGVVSVLNDDIIPPPPVGWSILANGHQFTDITY